MTCNYLIILRVLEDTHTIVGVDSIHQQMNANLAEGFIIIKNKTLIISLCFYDNLFVFRLWSHANHKVHAPKLYSNLSYRTKIVTNKVAGEGIEPTAHSVRSEGTNH